MHTEIRKIGCPPKYLERKDLAKGNLYWGNVAGERVRDFVFMYTRSGELCCVYDAVAGGLNLGKWNPKDITSPMEFEFFTGEVVLSNDKAG